MMTSTGFEQYFPPGSRTAVDDRSGGHMDASSVAYLGMLLYTLYVLLPIVPAWIIFRQFPDTKVAVSGPFQALTVNASGAFAAYLVTVAAGYVIIDRIQDSILDSQDVSEWTIGAPLARDTAGQLPRIQEVTFRPTKDAFTMGEDRVYFVVHRKPGDAWPVVVMSADGYRPQALDLRQRAFEATGLRKNLEIKGEPVKLQEVPRQFKDSAYEETAPLQPLADSASSARR
jgi:hypothetical protein